MQWSLYRYRRQYRRAWLDTVLRPGSRWRHLLRGGPLLWLLQVSLAVGLSLLLLISLSRPQHWLVWTAWLLLAPLWVWLSARLSARAQQDLRPEWAVLVLYRLRFLLTSSAMLLLLVALALFQPAPDLTDASFRQTLSNFLHQHPADSLLLSFGVDLLNSLDGLRHWLVWQMADHIPRPALGLLVLTLVTIQEWLLVWPMLVLFAGVHQLIDPAALTAREAGNASEPD
ncbi:hypothetical protein E4656_00410 [Natronospirillum operosum]|uniref:Uncharacterized protein n=1 Tax=Natronospirillum operosum TaxID=2759953 RepID=A0A4Z0WE45_9GAMM|nr:hypothetical protein [Natronospirillum operosum]TGG94928.1 hypothetical protein E4656_00410 [Natronospirillum operosum]